MPGQYTFILPATREVPRRMLHPRRRTVGVRIPQHPVALAIIAELGEPLVSSTLLLPGEDTPMTEGWEIKETSGSSAGRGGRLGGVRRGADHGDRLLQRRSGRRPPRGRRSGALRVIGSDQRRRRRCQAGADPGRAVDAEPAGGRGDLGVAGAAVAAAPDPAARQRAGEPQGQLAAATRRHRAAAVRRGAAGRRAVRRGRVRARPRLFAGHPAGRPALRPLPRHRLLEPGDRPGVAQVRRADPVHLRRRGCLRARPAAGRRRAERGHLLPARSAPHRAAARALPRAGRRTSSSRCSIGPGPAAGCFAASAAASTWWRPPWCRRAIWPGPSPSIVQDTWLTGPRA